jgi:hypothetical protein
MQCSLFKTRGCPLLPTPNPTKTMTKDCVTAQRSCSGKREKKSGGGELGLWERV